MAESKIITLPKVGDVLLERSYRAKHINISVKPPKIIRVAVPVGVEFEKARKIAEIIVNNRPLEFADELA